MTSLSRLLEGRVHPSNPSYWVSKLFGGGAVTHTGKVVTAESSLTVSAVYAAVRLLAETVGSIPLITYERLQPRGKKRDLTHRLYKPLHDQPNRWQTSMEWREMMQAHATLRGDAYSREVVTNEFGFELIPLHPDRVTPHKGPPGAIFYEFRPLKGGTEIILQDEMFHLKGLSSNGIVGISPIALARESIGLSMAAEEVGARLFGNSSVPKGVLQHPNKLGVKAYERLKESWEERHKGLQNSNKVAILEEGMEWKQVGLTAEDSQFLQTRKFQVEEVARWFNIPPHMLRQLDRATFSNIEQQSLEFVTYSIRPWLVRWEQVILRDLYVGRESETHFTEFLVEGLLRGDFKTRWEGYAIGKQNGILNADEIRALENLNPQEEPEPGKVGEIYYVPLNMVPAGSQALEPSLDGPVDAARSQVVNFNVSAMDPEGFERWLPDHKDDLTRMLRESLGNGKERRTQRSIQSRRRLQGSHRNLFEDAASRFLTREIHAVDRLVKRFLPDDPDKFIAEMRTFYDGHISATERIMLPVLLAFAEGIHAAAADEISTTPDFGARLQAFAQEYVRKMALGVNTHSRKRLTQRAREENPDEAVDRELREWEESRAFQVARREVIEADGAFSVATWAAAGVLTMRWVTIGDNCPYCDEMEGRVVEIVKNFIGGGETITPEGEQTFTTTRNMRHPPLHDGCDCMVAAG